MKAVWVGTVSVDGFRDCLDCEDRTQCQRRLVQRRGKGVVYGQQRPVLMRKLRDRGDVRNAIHGIVRGLDVHESRSRRDGPANRIQIRQNMRYTAM